MKRVIPPYLRLVHSQPAENCITVVEMRSFNLPLVLALVGCIAFHTFAAYTIINIVKSFSTEGGADTTL